MAHVRDIVGHRVLFSVQEDETVAGVARQMAEFHVGAILVTERSQIRGVFSERDLMLRVVLQKLDPASHPASELPKEAYAIAPVSTAPPQGDEITMTIVVTIPPSLDEARSASSTNPWSLCSLNPIP